MIRNVICIGKLYRTEHEGLTRISSNVRMNFDNSKINKTFFYEVENRWAKYLVDEVSDAFIIAFLELAMEKNADIYYETPASEELIFNLERYLIPVVSHNIKELSMPELIGKMIQIDIKNEGVVGTGFSGGVDSFYSVLSHKDTKFRNEDVSHVLLGVNGAAMTGQTEELDRIWFDGEKKRFLPITKELGLELIAVNSNISLLNEYKKYLLGGDTILTSSFVHILRKLFGRYYWASAVRANEMEFNKDDGNLMELFVAPLLSVKGLTFMVDGEQVSRIEKVEFIADNNIVQKSIDVCGELGNCGKCNKCLRTMGELYAIDKLQLFKQSFPVDDFLKNPAIQLARLIGLDYEHKVYFEEIFSKMRQNGKKVPLLTYILGYIIYVPFNIIRPKLKGKRFFELIYHEWGMYKLFGGRKENKFKV